MYNYYLKGKILPFLLLMLLSSSEVILAQTAVSDSVTTEQQKLKMREEISLLHKDQDVKELLQATSTIYTEQLITTPAPSFLQALPGRLSGLYTRQRSGIQDTDDPVSVMDFRIRGQIPTILVDGIPRDFASIELESIASISVLKDALSTVMYGQRSSNNIILVTTKRPAITPFKLSATIQHGSQSLINMPKVLPADEYAILYNEARMNDGLSPVYSAADILAYRNGSDPYGRPNVNWQEEALNKSTNISRYNVNIENGNDIARFYVALDYLKEGGFFKTSGLNSYNTNTQVDRYIVRSNVEVDLNSSLKVGLNVFGRMQSSNQPGGTTTSTFTAINTTPQNAYPIFNPDSSLGGNTNYTNNIYGLINNSGYRTYSSRDLSVDMAITQELDKLTPGLWAKADVSYNNTTDQTVNRSKSFAIFNPLGGSSYQQIGQNQTMGSSFSFSARRTYTYGKLSLGYDRSFSDDHKISGLLLADFQSTTINLDLPASYSNYAANATYSYKEKYFAELAGSYAGFNRYMPGKQYGLFYAAGLGWNIAKEEFLAGHDWINSLKPRISFGRTGNANVGYYVYEQYYDNAGTAYYFGTNATAAQGFSELALANQNATWEKADKLNIGVDAVFFNNRLSVTSEYFNDTYHDLMQIRGRSSQIIGQAYPTENIGKNRYSGFENSVSWNGKSNLFNYFISGNASFLKSNVIYQDEVFREFDYQRRTGLPVGQTFGYIAEGFFDTQEEINNSPRVEGYNPVPGDLKYRDLNDDGIINQFDEAPIGTQKPLIYYGLTAGFSIKGFDASVSFQGVANRDIVLSGSLEYEFENSGLGQAYQHHLYRWTPENAENATYPRLSIGTNINNQRYSTFWVRSADYLRLQNVDIGYTIPASLTKRFKVNAIRIFANGFNLHSFDKLDHNDPENSSVTYPFLRKTINAGINIKL